MLPPSLRYRLLARGSGRDAEKLARFDAFTASMRLDAEPAAPHLTVDNRLSAPAPVDQQVARLAL